MGGLIALSQVPRVSIATAHATYIAASPSLSRSQRVFGENLFKASRAMSTLGRSPFPSAAPSMRRRRRAKYPSVAPARAIPLVPTAVDGRRFWSMSSSGRAADLIQHASSVAPASVEARVHAVNLMLRERMDVYALETAASLLDDALDAAKGVGEPHDNSLLASSAADLNELLAAHYPGESLRTEFGRRAEAQHLYAAEMHYAAVHALARRVRVLAIVGANPSEARADALEHLHHAAFRAAQASFGGDGGRSALELMLEAAEIMLRVSGVGEEERWNVLISESVLDRADGIMVASDYLIMGAIAGLIQSARWSGPTDDRGPLRGDNRLRTDLVFGAVSGYERAMRIYAGIERRLVSSEIVPSPSLSVSEGLAFNDLLAAYMAQYFTRVSERRVLAEQLAGILRATFVDEYAGDEPETDPALH